MARDDLSGAAVHGVIRWMLEPKPLRSRYTGVLFCRSRMRLALLPRFSGFPNDRQRIPMRCREVHPKTSIDPSTALWPRYAMPIQLDRAPSHTSHGTEALSRSGRPDVGVALLCRSLPTDLHKLDRCRTSPQPSPYGDQRPNCLKHSEGPRPLEESVDGTKDTGCRKGQDERSAAIFQRVTDQHRRNRGQTEKSEGIHGESISDRNKLSLSDRRVAATYPTSL